MTRNWIIGVLALPVMAYWFVHAWRILPGLLHPRMLSRVRPVDISHADQLPLISVIVAARNESATIRQCLESLALQHYSNIEIIAVNDRSTDDTGRIIDELSAGNARIRGIHVTTLLPGWIGKNHANWRGAAEARGEWLLFTDGDIIFECDTFSRAMAHVVTEDLDHLCLFPGLISDSYWEQAAVGMFGFLFFTAYDLRNVRNPLKPAAFCGIGAFNLVRSVAYRAAGGHEPLRMEVADDVKLGKLLKRHGFVTDVLHGAPLVRVRWQVGLWGIIRGLEKNAFAGSDWRLPKATLGVTALTLMSVMPPIGTLFTTGWLRVSCLVWWAAGTCLLALGAKCASYRPIVGLGAPIACLVLAFALGRSVVLAVWRGGIYWRETFYSLDALRKGVV